MKSIPFPLQYRHPLWQKFRLKVLEARDYTCEMCGTKDDQLHVHHGYYEKGKMIWEYPMWSVWSLCDSCHKQTTSSMKEVRKAIAGVNPAKLAVLFAVADALSDCRDTFDGPKTDLLHAQRRLAEERLPESIREDYESGCDAFSDSNGNPLFAYDDYVLKCIQVANAMAGKEDA